MKENTLEDIFRACGGLLRVNEALERGITRHRLYALRDAGVIWKVRRGMYALSELPDISNPDLVIVSTCFPNAVVCLVSALSFHEITTQIPRSISVAVPRRARAPVLDYPPVDAHHFSGQAYVAGIEEHLIDDHVVKIYSIEKTLADCVKFRNKIGMDVVSEACKFYRSRKRLRVDELLHYAKICRVEKLMHQYLELGPSSYA